MKTMTFKLMISAAIVAGSIGFFATNANAYDSIVCGTRAGFVGDGSANYKPGVDAHGKSVAPADLSPQMPGMGEVIRVPMSINLEQRLSKMLPAGTELKADAGLVEIYRDGRVMYNGMDITTQTNTLCREKPVVEQAPPKKKVKKVAAPVVESEPVAAEPVTEEPAPIVQDMAPAVEEQAPAVVEETPAPEATAPESAPETAPETAPVPSDEMSGEMMMDPAQAPSAPPASPLPEGSLPVPAETIPAPDAPLAPAMQAPETLSAPPADQGNITILAPEAEMAPPPAAMPVPAPAQAPAPATAPRGPEDDKLPSAGGL